MKRLLLIATAALTLAAIAGYPSHAAAPSAPVGRPSPAQSQSTFLPTPNVDWDYQIGGAFTPAPSVGIVSRDRNAAASAGDYNICYVNAFQTQPDEVDFWTDDPAHWALVLKDSSGDPVIDGDWGEFLLDTRTAAKRTTLIGIVGPWIDGCAADGFQATEFDNLDSWDRSDGLITKAHNKAFAQLLTARSHASGLAAGQKNWSELSPSGPGLGFDFAVAEECGRYNECGAYASAYANRVYVVEYRDQDFTKACTKFGATLSIVRRNVAVTPGGVNKRC